MTRTRERFSLLPISKGGVEYVCKLSFEDRALISAYRWKIDDHTTGRPFVYANHNGKTVLLHRLIVECPEGYFVDHINHDPLDNRRQNLRIATPSQNSRNMLRHKDSKSPFKGVYQHRERWVAKIENQNLGSFATAEHAALAYNDAAARRFGEFACFNELPTQLVEHLRATMDEGARPKRSRFKGVSFVEPCKKPWRAIKRVSGVDHRLGFFDTEMEAARAIDDLCRRLGLGREHMNFPDERAVRVRVRYSIADHVNTDPPPTQGANSNVATSCNQLRAGRRAKASS